MPASSRFLAGPALALTVALLVPTGARAQTECDLVGSNYFRQIQGSSGPITFVSRPVIRCGDGTRIVADSAAIYGARNYSEFFGNVEFQDSVTALTSERAHFFSQEGRLQAWEAVVLTDRAEGSRITGDTLVYLRPIEARPTEQITVTGRRPHATLYPAPAEPDSVGEPDPEAADTLAPDTPADSARAPAGGRGDVRGGLAPPEEDPDTVPPTVRDSAEGARPDSPGELQDSVTEPPDSLAPPLDRPGGVADTLAGVGDRAAADTSGALPDTTPPPPPEPEDTVRIPWEVDADRIFLEGERYFRATGSVEIVRDSLEAYGDSVEYDQRAGRLFITESARLLAADYVLLGRLITLVIPAGELSEVVSRENAELTGEDLRLTAPEIRLYLAEGRAQRLVAVHRPPRSGPADAPRGPQGDPEAAPPPRPRAVATQFLLVADSIEARTPDEVLERVVASGRARGESLARDSLNTPETPEIARRDWLEGDTVVALFEPDTSTVPADTARPGYRLERVVATGSARSLYRMEPADSAAGPERLALHYVQGRVISIQMEAGEVREMEVEGQTRGMYLEPLRRASPDSTAGPGSSRGPARGGGRP